MNKHIKYLIYSVLIGVVVGNLLSVHLVTPKNITREKKLERLLNYIEQDYVDSVNTDKLLDDAIINVLKQLDPHSVYIPKEELQAVTENMQGNFVGIGVQFRMINDTITVVKPIEKGPSVKVGIKAGDRILIANQDTLYNRKLTTENIFKSLKGDRGSKVKLKVYRKTNDSLFYTTVKRDKVNITSIDVSYMLNKTIGYIKLERFAQNTFNEFKNALNELLKQGMTDLVLDLRGNGGGYLHIANKIVDEFLEDGKLIVFTKNNKDEVDEYIATEKGSFEKGNVFVLIDESSASASEILAGALQDNDKGTIIGRRSFGKGLVQEERNLGDGSAIRLTIARYYTPTGRCIQKPYHPEQEHGTEDYQAEIYHRSAELYNKDSIKIIDSLAYKTPKGKIVYGGGGIVPDVFIPIDTSRFLPTFYYKYLNDFAFDYVDNNRKEFSKLSINTFNKTFNSKKVLDNFLNYLHKSGNKTKFSISDKTKKNLKYYLKIIIARELFDNDKWYKIKQKDDEMIQKVFELKSK